MNLECIEMLAFDEMMHSIVAMVDEYMPPPLENEEQPVLSDDTMIRGVSWGDFKDEAMEPDFDPSFFFVSTSMKQNSHICKVLQKQQFY